MSKNINLKVISLFLIFLFIFFSLGAEFLHNHSDRDFHNDCSICLWLSAINNFVFFCILVCLGFLIENPPPVFYNNTPVFISKPFHIIQYLRSPPSQCLS